MQDIMANGFIFGGISLFSAVMAVFVTGLARGPHPPEPPQNGGAVHADTLRRYEFRHGYLVSDLDPDDAFLTAATDRSAAFDVIARSLGALHPDLPARLRGLSLRGEPFALTGTLALDPLTISGRAAGDRLIVTIGPVVSSKGYQMVEDTVLDALHDDADDLRRTLDLGRAAMWKENAQHHVIWANAAYLALAGQAVDTIGPVPTWPVARLFQDQLDHIPDPGTRRRCHLVRPGVAQEGLWFDVSAQPRSGATLFYATPIDGLVAAETALRNFVQTLSKTFAHLPIGLAIFDKRRDLIIFNPALVTLSTLSPAFLSGRPGLVAFLDALRDAQRMPEPKNYRTWRDDLARLEQGAQDGTYQELWTLPSGQSLRVMGRPHPDGAVAFLFEDITAEVSLTRKFRGDLDLYRAALDQTPGALAVFSAEGRLMLANPGYGALWGVDRQTVVGVQTVAAATLDWQGRAGPSAVWGDIRAFAAHRMERTVWASDIDLPQVGLVTLTVAPLAGGAMSVRFVRHGADADARPPGGAVVDASARNARPHRLHPAQAAQFAVASLPNRVALDATGTGDDV